MTHEQLYNELLRRGFHEDFLDECSTEDLQRIFDTGATRS